MLHSLIDFRGQRYVVGPYRPHQPFGVLLLTGNDRYVGAQHFLEQLVAGRQLHRKVVVLGLRAPGAEWIVADLFGYRHAAVSHVHRVWVDLSEKTDPGVSWMPHAKRHLGD